MRKELVTTLSTPEGSSTTMLHALVPEAGLHIRADIGIPIGSESSSLQLPVITSGMGPEPFSSPPSHRKRQGAPPRKKACQSCTKSKVRCSLDRPVCSRCRVSRRACVYPVLGGSSNSGPATAYHTAIEDPVSESYPDVSMVGTRSIDPLPEMPTPVAPSTSGSIWHSPVPPHRHVGTRGSNQSASSFNFVDISLVPSANAGDIRDRWLRPYILPPLGQEEIPKVYNPFTLQYISRVLATYPRFMLKDGGLPPIIHWAQITGREMPQSLANCYSLVRLWEQAVPGSEAMVISTVEREMERLAAEVSRPSPIFDVL